MPHLSWRRVASHPGLPPQWRPWLSDDGSLTARIKARCGQFTVRVLREGYAPPLESERRLLGLRRGALAWVREVLLLADDVPVVFAHSVAARQDLRGAWRIAAGGGTRPLGAALFADPAIERRPLYAARVRAGDRLHGGAEQALAVALPALWARRSVFFHAQRPLLVTEVFLPEIAKLVHPPGTRGILR
jgi:chorismate lyase